jgi:hypothetical protein
LSLEENTEREEKFFLEAFICALRLTKDALSSVIDFHLHSKNPFLELS